MPQKYALKQYDTDAFYHVFFRGINKQIIFNDDEDRSYFLSLLDRYFLPQKLSDKVKYPNYLGLLEVHAYCLMDNHVHMLIYQREEAAALKSFMASLLTSYSKYFNRKHKRVGTLYESRYKARIITDESYLTHITRYVHMNPKNWQNYRWSSIGYIFNNTERPQWLDTRLYQDFNQKSYNEFLREYQTEKDKIKEIKHLLAG